MKQILQSFNLCGLSTSVVCQRNGVTLCGLTVGLRRVLASVFVLLELQSRESVRTQISHRPVLEVRTSGTHWLTSMTGGGIKGTEPAYAASTV